MIVCVLTACRPPRKTITLYFAFPFSVIISARVLYALSCPSVSKPRHTSSQHPSSSTSSTHNPHSMPPPLLKCHQGSAKMPSRPQIQKSGTCTFVRSPPPPPPPTPSCLPAHMYPPTYLCFTKRSIRNISSERSAKSPHGCLCHLAPIHSQVVMRLVLRRLVVKDGLVWSRRVLVSALTRMPE